MESIYEGMAGDHKRCDDYFIQAENATNSNNWPEAETAFAQFCAALERHLTLEEETLFPAFEQVTGNTAGPTSMMRMEHRQIRGIVETMQSALLAQDGEAFLGESETLNTMMQQHNLKEENILYPMMDRVLATQQGPLLEQIHTRLVLGHPAV